MNRREIITLIGSAAAAWPLAARAQQSTNAPKEKAYRIGFLFAGSIALRPEAQEFWRTLQELGYIDGKNLDFFDRRTSRDFPGPIFPVLFSRIEK